MKNDNELIRNIDKIHTTALGIARIRRNLELDADDAVSWCRRKTELAAEIIRKGKNWYVITDDSVITINAHSYTIITAHKTDAAANAINSLRGDGLRCRK
ncbi:MAG: DUF3781 domain-containing protein [Synergistaceae bacterium]|nr:DUF3781 domain-containing protein [Synergistaceae bacterium]